MKDWRKKYLFRAWLRRWQYLLGFEKWMIRIRYVYDIPPDFKGEKAYGDAETFSNFEDKTAKIVFNLKRHKTEEKIRRTCIHELLHLVADEETKEVHQWIRRLERRLDRVPRRIGGVF